MIDARVIRVRNLSIATEDSDKIMKDYDEKL